MRKRQRVGRDQNAGVCGRSVLIVALVSLFHGVLMPGCSWARTPTDAGPLSRPHEPFLDVSEPLGLARSHWPMTAGVPFPAGAVPDVSRLGIRLAASGDAGMPTALQSRVLSRWPDGSVRWALLDWQADLQPRQALRFHVGPATAAAPARSVKVVDRGDRVDVDTGPLQFSVPRNRFAVLSDVRVDGRPVLSGPVVSFFDIDGKRIGAQPPGTVTVTEGGPLRVRIELRGQYASAFDYVVRLDAFAGQPFVRVLHTFEQHSPEPYVWVRQIGIDVPMRLEGTPAYRAGQETGAPWAGTLPAKGFGLFQEDEAALHVNGARRAGHAAGWADLYDATHGVALASRFFWQEYPQSFQLRASGLTYNVWAPEASPAKVGMGAAKTHEFFLYFHAKTPPPGGLMTALARPLLAGVDPSWTVAAGALRNSIAAGVATTAFLRQLEGAYRRYQAHAEQDRWDDSGGVHCPDAGHERPRQGYFGMFNWGDWNFPGYHDSTKGCDAWGNLEYDMTQVLALAYAATGEPAYYERMVAAARHFMDVDRISHHRGHPEWVGMNHPKNPLHFAFELGGPDLGHTWTEGLLSYYYLTGDERGLEAARGIADYLVRRMRVVLLRGNPRQWGWPQIALIAAYEATGTDAYKTAALEYARKGMAAHPPDHVDHWKMGILAEALSYTHSVTHDTAIGDWLVRYAAAVSARGAADPRFYPAVAYVGRINGKAEYLRAAAATVARLKFGNWGKPFTIVGRVGFRILALTTADAPSPLKP